MSYLDLPRLHFSGLLYNYPNTINNKTSNFDPCTPLTDKGIYVFETVSWAPLGSGQVYFQDCVVRGATDSRGKWIAGGDPLIGADFNTPSPFTPIPDGEDGTYDIPKMVNLDPDWDDRTEFYGMQLQVVLPNGATFGGRMSVPQVREMSYDRFKIDEEEQRQAVRPYQQAGILLGVIEKAQWPDADAGSPLLRELMSACGHCIAVEMTMDLCWSRNQAAASIPGRRYLYGRVHGTLGPVRPGEGRQTIFGRRMQQLKDSGWNAAYAATSQVGSQTFLSIDLGMATPVAVQNWDSNFFPSISGVTVVDRVTVGVVGGAGTFQPLSQGEVSFAPYQYNYKSDAKDCILLTNSGVFTIALTAADTALLAAGALALRANGYVVAQEASSGIWIQFDDAIGRAEIDTLNVNIDVLVTKRGSPAPGYQIPGLAAWTWQYSGKDSTQAVLAPGYLSANYSGATGGSGQTTLEIRALQNRLELQTARVPLDSQVFFFLPETNDPSISYGDYVLDRPCVPPKPIPPPDPPLARAPLDAPVCLLVWQACTPPAEPDWQRDILPILGGYSRLYPGMREKLDIGHEATARGNSLGIAARMSLSVDDPAYMPVTRDLSPTKVKMIADFMTRWAKLS